MISRVLVANRGEIARRIFRTCRAMGIGTVAVYSEPDADEPHVREADRSVALQGATPRETYLDIDALIEAAKSSEADAVHPGYGFLAENASFARAVIDAGITWIGPPPEAIESMGSKIEAKSIMEKAGVPILPSVDAENGEDIETRVSSIGFPVLVKASAGGGGKGMRIVESADVLAEAIESARREAESAFGDGTLFVEKYLDSPRHIEIQVMADQHGNVVSFHERDCSIQRRHQKIIEEAPSPAIDDSTRLAMGEAAVAAARAVGYVGAGTVEFLFQDGDFYFLEMNTRLQVEHPVTEMVTGVDLVQLQIEIASGDRIDDQTPEISGHAIEARLYAEDATNDYLPSTGVFHRFGFPEVEGLRVDSGIEAGSRVGVEYDPMLAKVIAHAATREAAAKVLAQALRQATIHGSTTNRALLVRILEHPEFLKGDTDTHFLLRHDPSELARPLLDEYGERIAAVAVALADQAQQRRSSPVLQSIPSGWRNVRSTLQTRAYRGAHGRHDISYSLHEAFEAPGLGAITAVEASPGSVTIEVGTEQLQFSVSRHGDRRFVEGPYGPAVLEILPRFPTSVIEDEPGSLHAPMPGKVIRVEVSVGEEVEEGQSLVVLEAMKMERTLRSPLAGRVTSVSVSVGDQVEANAVLVVVEAD